MYISWYIYQYLNFLLHNFGIRIDPMTMESSPSSHFRACYPQIFDFVWKIKIEFNLNSDQDQSLLSSETFWYQLQRWFFYTNFNTDYMSPVSFHNLVVFNLYAWRQPIIRIILVQQAWLGSVIRLTLTARHFSIVDSIKVIRSVSHIVSCVIPTVC